MGPWLGDFVEDSTVHLLWETAGLSGQSITRATNGTVSVYKDNGLTQSTAGITDTEDFDSLTGIHALTIDLSADAFYAPGANYSIVLSGAVIDGQTVNTVLGHFSIENRAAKKPADIAAGLLDLAAGVETNLTVREFLRGAASLLLSEGSGLDGSTPVFRDFNDTKDRLQFDVTAGVRTVVRDLA